MNKIKKMTFYTEKIFFIKDSPFWSLSDAYYGLRSYKRGVAQLGSAGALGALGRRFESCRPDHLETKSY